MPSCWIVRVRCLKELGDDQARGGVLDRLCFVCDMLIDFDGNVTKSKFYEAVMHSNARLTYTQVWKAVGEKDEEARAALGPVLPHVERLHQLYQVLAKAREKRGAIEFESSEVRFLLDQKLKQWGKSYAWVPSTTGARPKFGDIFQLPPRLHQGISLDFDGDFWNTAEGGQGGKSHGNPPFDLIKRKQARQTSDVVTNEKGETLKGWLDIERFLNGPPIEAPILSRYWFSVHEVLVRR